VLLWSTVLHADGFIEIIGCMCLIAVAIPVSIGLRVGISEMWRNILSPLVSQVLKRCTQICVVGSIVLALVCAQKLSVYVYLMFKP